MTGDYIIKHIKVRIPPELETVKSCSICGAEVNENRLEGINGLVVNWKCYNCQIVGSIAIEYDPIISRRVN